MEEITCSICCDPVRLTVLRDLDKDDSHSVVANIRQTPTNVCLLMCNHAFHSWCLIPHLNNKRNCPNCRSLVQLDKLVFIPDGLTSTEKVQVCQEVDLSVILNAGVPKQDALMKLHKDLARREEQIEQLEMQLESNIYSDDDDDEGDLNETRLHLSEALTQNAVLNRSLTQIKTELNSVNIELNVCKRDLKAKDSVLNVKEAKIRASLNLM